MQLAPESFVTALLSWYLNPSLGRLLSRDRAVDIIVIYGLLVRFSNRLTI